MISLRIGFFILKNVEFNLHQTFLFNNNSRFVRFRNFTLLYIIRNYIKHIFYSSSFYIFEKHSIRIYNRRNRSKNWSTLTSLRYKTIILSFSLKKEKKKTGVIQKLSIINHNLYWFLWTRVTRIKSKIYDFPIWCT